MPLSIPLNNVSGLYLATSHVSGSGELALNAGAGDAIQAALDEMGVEGVTSETPIRITVVKASAVNSFGQITRRGDLTVFQVTGLTGDTLTGCTAIEGTTDRAYAPGDRAGAFITAGTVREIHEALDGKLGPSDSISSSQLPGSGVAPGNYQFATFAIDTKGRVTSATALTPPTITGSRLDGTALANLLSQLDGLDLVIDTSTAGAIAQSQVTNLVSDLAAKAALTGATFTGTVTATSPNNTSKSVVVKAGNTDVLNGWWIGQGYPGSYNGDLLFGRDDIGLVCKIDQYGFELMGARGIAFRSANSGIQANHGNTKLTTDDGSFNWTFGAQNQIRIQIGGDTYATLTASGWQFSVAPKLPTLADASIPNAGIAWSSTDVNVLKCRTPAGTLKVINLT